MSTIRQAKPRSGASAGDPERGFRHIPSYDLGAGYGHVAIEVEDAYKACEEVRKRGGRVTREAGPMKHGSTVIAFVEDPDGYKIEFIQRRI